LNEIKSLQERVILDIFRSNFQAFPKGRLIKTESPDFVLKTSPKRSIGIELTALPAPVYAISGETIPVFIADLQLTIMKKEEKLKNYKKKKVDEYWLVINAGFIDVHSINFNNHIDKLTVCSGFKRIFLFETSKGFVWELATTTLGVFGIEYPKGIRNRTLK
jgi:hypothetical protein